MAWHELPLMLFTVMGQTAVGAFLLMAFVLLQGQPDSAVRVSIIKNMFFLWLLMGVGFAASTGHLGSPIRALNALNRTGSSWLSNEIFFGSLFFALGGLFWLAEMLAKGSAGIRKGMMIAAMAFGLAFVYAMSKVYMIETVPTWNVVYTPASFFITVVVSGGLFGYMLLSAAGYVNAKLNAWLPTVAVIAVVLSIIVSVYQVGHLSGLETAVMSASELLPNINSLKAMYITLLVVALVVWLLPRFKAQNVTFTGLLASAVLVFVAEFLNRAIFYSLHMSVGL